MLLIESVLKPLETLLEIIMMHFIGANCPPIEIVKTCKLLFVLRTINKKMAYMAENKLHCI